MVGVSSQVAPGGLERRSRGRTDPLPASPDCGGRNPSMAGWDGGSLEGPEEAGRSGGEWMSLGGDWVSRGKAGMDRDEAGRDVGPWDGASLDRC